MSNSGNQSPATENKFVESIADNIPNMGVTYNGKALFLPNITNIVIATGVSRVELSRGRGLEAKLKAATGLDIVHRSGFVLGDAACVDPIVDQEFLDESRAMVYVERLASEAERLSPAAREALIARLAIGETQTT